MSLDDDLHGALGGDAAGGGGTGDFADVRGRAIRIRRRRLLTTSGSVAVVAAVALLGAVAATGNDAADDVVTEQPEETTTAVEVTTSTTAPATTTTAGVAPGARPTEIAAVVFDGEGGTRLVVIDAASGAEVRELARLEGPDPDLSIPDDRGWNYLNDVTVATTGMVYYTESGEPIYGFVRGVPLDGTEDPADLGEGNFVAVSPDASALAISNTPTVFTVSTSDTITADEPEGGGVLDEDIEDGRLLGYASLGWLPDGQTIVVDAYRHESDAGIIVVRVDGSDQPRQFEPPDDSSLDWSRPAVRRDGMIVIAEQAPYCFVEPDECDTEPVARVIDPSSGEVVASFSYGSSSVVVDQSYDATGTWLLVTFRDGTMRWYGGGQSGVVPGNSYRAGDW